ncbi:MAG: Rrf2 family transcriptional regulator [Nitrososphaerota archaeon]|jgi:Rrf2 family nitric oxide-sensitive transcriptional repressor|nr:Rrf2 family transcriptional regulator [Nitrososphaerota archaeon]
MVQLNVMTDYGIRVVLYLAITQKNAEQMVHEKGLRDERSCIVVSSAKICSEMGIPSTMMYKIARVLKGAGVIRERRGSAGGFELIKSVEDVSILDITRAFEKTMNVNRCLEEDAFCSRNASQQCIVRSFYTELQHKLDEMLSVKVSTFLKNT